MADTLILYLVIASFVGLWLVLYVLLFEVLRWLRGLSGLGVALIVKLVLADIWIQFFLGSLIYNHYVRQHPLPDWWFVGLAGSLCLMVWGFLGYYDWWKKSRKGGKDS